MLTDFDAALLCYSSYFAPMDFDSYETGEKTDGVRYGVKNYADCVAVVFQGSTSLLDWERDFQADMIDDEEIGQVHRGFVFGMTKVLAEFLPLVNVPGAPRLPIVVTGHSLGAARALIFGAILQLTGHYDVTIIAFESPRPGGDRLTEIISKMKVRSYRNGSDPITQLPRAFPHMPYQQPSDLIRIKCERVTGDCSVVFGDHHIQNVIVGLARHLGGYHE